MDPEFTAGPWEFDPLLGEISSADLAMIAKVYEPGDFPCADPGVYTEEEYRANGALLAAAPDLLAAAELAIEELRFSAYIRCRGVLGQLRDAVRRAHPEGHHGEG